MASGDPGALHWSCQLAGLFVFLTWPLGCSGAADRVSLGEKLMNTGCPSFPQTENSHSISEQCVFSVQSCNSEGREWDRRNPRGVLLLRGADTTSEEQ